MRYALVDKTSYVVDNIIELDQNADWVCPDACELVQSDIANIGDTYSNGKFSAPQIKQ